MDYVDEVASQLVVADGERAVHLEVAEHELDAIALII